MALLQHEIKIAHDNKAKFMNEDYKALMVMDRSVVECMKSIAKHYPGNIEVLNECGSWLCFLLIAWNPGTIYRVSPKWFEEYPVITPLDEKVTIEFTQRELAVIARLAVGVSGNGRLLDIINEAYSRIYNSQNTDSRCLSFNIFKQSKNHCMKIGSLKVN